MSSFLRFFKRLLVVGISALLALAMLATSLAAIALRADWQVPDRRDLAAPSVMTDRGGRPIARFTSEQDRQVVSLARISKDAQNAVIASEDIRFYEHTGVDPVSLLRAVYRNVRTGGIEQGGSTLTQQFVKNALEGVGNERTIIRKVREAVVSIALERRVVQEEGGVRGGKDRILQDYLNTVYFGESAFGIQAAAKEFFGVDSRDLTAGQGALLAQSLPAPSVRNPRVDPDGARQRRDRILATMLLNGLIDQETHDREVAIDVEVEVQSRTTQATEHPFFVEYARRQVAEQFGEDALLTGGLEIRTTLDVRVQQAIEDAVAEVLPQQDAEDDRDVDAGVVVIEPRSGDILAIYGGRDFMTQQLDLATQGRRQNGSTFKPFGFLAALEAGRNPDSLIATPGSQTIRPSDCTGSGRTPLIGSEWGPIRGPGGRMPLREALTRSVNPAFQRLACDLGPAPIIDVATRMGVRNEIDEVPSVGLGGSAYGASVLDLASAYATLANDGVHCPARSILRVRDNAGASLPAFGEVTIVPDMPVRSRIPSNEELAARPRGLEVLDQGRCLGALNQDHARVTTLALMGVVEKTTGRRAQIGRAQAGKTGTTNNETDAWFVGYTPEIAMAVWVGHRACGNSDDEACWLRDIEGFGKVQGGTIPALIWKAAAERILENRPATEFPRPGETLSGARLPAPPRATPTPTATPTPSASPSASDPTADPTADPTPTEEPSEGPCIVVLGNC